VSTASRNLTSPTRPLLSSALALCGGLVGCGLPAGDDLGPRVSAETTATAALEATSASLRSATSENPALEGSEDARLRRGYGAIDMRFNDCVSKVNDFTLQAKDCAPGFVVYGPYVPVPAKSEIEVSFEIKATKRLDVYADIVSQMGAQVLAGLAGQAIEAGGQRKLGYRVSVFNADVNVESRIGTTAEPGTSFEVTNLTMTVR